MTRLSRAALARLGLAPEAGRVTSAYAHVQRGRREDLDGQFFRSAWEANYARFLAFLKAQGEILDWAYEPETFVFAGVTRAPVNYTPDFRVTERDGRIVYHEVKGWMDGKSKSKLKRMGKFYPTVQILVVGREEYNAIAKWKALIPGWETGTGAETR